MVQLLGRRGEHCSNMATSLMKQLEQKMKASNLTTSEVLQLSQHLEESGLPQGCRDDLLAQCDQLAMQGSHQSAVKLSQQQQSCDNLTNYLTAGDWKALKQLHQLQEGAGKLAVGSAGGWQLAEQKDGQRQSLELVARQVQVQKATFGTMGCRPRARSVLHCHGVLALRGGPWPGAVQDESWQAKSRLGASF